MVAYDLSDPLVFVGSRSMTGLQVFKLVSRIDESKPKFRLITTIGGARSYYTHLKLFNATILATSLRSLINDLEHNKLYVNRDGYCCVRMSGFEPTSPTQPDEFMRLNDLFPWGDYVDDVPIGERFNPTPSKTIWNRVDLSSGDKKVDYEKLGADLEGAIKDKKEAEKAKKEYEDMLNQTNKVYEDILNKAMKENEEKINKTKNENKEIRKKLNFLSDKISELYPGLCETWFNELHTGN